MRWLTLQQLKSKNPATRLQMVEKLVASDDLEAAEALVSVLTDEDPTVRKTAVKGLGKLRARESAAALIGLMRDPHPEVRQATATALKQIGDRQAVSTLAAALKDDNASVRYHVMSALEALNWVPRDNTERALRCVALGKLHQAAEYGAAAIDALVGELRTGVHYKRTEAVEALAKINDPRTVKPLTAALKDEDGNVRTKAVEALSRLKDPRAVEPLIAALRDADSRVRAASVEALGKIGDERSLQALLGLLQDSSGEVRKAAVEALSKISDPSLVDVFLKLVRDSEPDIRQMTARVLGKLDDRRAIAPLVIALIDDNENVRRTADAALRNLDPEWERSPEAFRAVPVLEAALHGDEYWIKQTVSAVLSRLVRQPSPAGDAVQNETATIDRATLRRQDALHILSSLLQDSDRDLRIAGIHGLEQFAGSEASAQIVELLKDSDHAARLAAARSLTSLNWQPADEREQIDWMIAAQNWPELISAGAAVVAPLIALTEDRSAAVRRQVAEVLGKIGGAEVIEPLMLLLNDAQKNVRRTAAHALVGMSNQLNEAQQLVLGYELAH